MGARPILGRESSTDRTGLIFSASIERLARTSIPRWDFWSGPIAFVILRTRILRLAPKSRAYANSTLKASSRTILTLMGPCRRRSGRRRFAPSLITGRIPMTSSFNIYQNLYIPMGVYNWARHQLTYGSATDRKATVSFYERFGGYYNGTLNEARVRATYRASSRLAFSFSEQWNRFHLLVTDGSAGAVPQARDFSVVLGTLETDYAFSRLLSLSTILQMNTANAQGASANIRLRWNYRPDSDLYVIYTAGQKFASLAAASPEQFYEHRFVVKYTYSFRP